MKGFVLVFALLAVTACAFANPEMKAAVDECKAEFGITDMPPKPEDDEQTAKCFGACIMKKLGKMDGGKVVLDKELEILSKMVPDFDDAKKAAVTECANKANEQSEECEVAHAMGKCLREGSLIPPHPMH